jgi:Ca2+-dependent lipid-binding protein
MVVVKAADILWGTPSSGQRNPNPFVKIYFEGKEIFSTTTKQQTLAPLWDERVEL